MKSFFNLKLKKTKIEAVAWYFIFVISYLLIMFFLIEIFYPDYNPQNMDQKRKVVKIGTNLGIIYVGICFYIGMLKNFQSKIYYKYSLISLALVFFTGIFGAAIPLTMLLAKEPNPTTAIK